MAAGKLLWPASDQRPPLTVNTISSKTTKVIETLQGYS